MGTMKRNNTKSTQQQNTKLTTNQPTTVFYKILNHESNNKNTPFYIN